MLFWLIIAISLVALCIAIIYEVFYTYRDGGLWK